MPGTTSNKATLSYLAKYTNDQGAYSYLNNVDGYTTPNTRYHRDVYNDPISKAVDIWTNPL